MKSSVNLKSVLSLFLIVAIAFASCKQDPKNTDDDNVVVNEPPKEQPKITEPEKEEVQKIEVPNEYFLPKVLKFDVEATKLSDKILPIGWSQDGKFAYVIEKADEACGCYMFEIVIQDLISDKKEWKWEFNDEGAGEDIKSTWQKNYKDFKQKLKEFEIIQNEEVNSIGNSFNFEDNSYTLTYETEKRTDPDWGIEVVDNATLILNKEGIGSKKVNSNKYGEYDVVLSVGVAATIQSPYEPRLAIIHFDELMGYEGSSNVINLTVSGSHLKKGFE